MKTYKANQEVSVLIRLLVSPYGTLFPTWEDTGKPHAGSYWEKEGYIHLVDRQTTFTVRPDYNQKADQIASLNARKEHVTREWNDTIGKLNAEISKLQAIEYTGEDHEDDPDIPF